MLFFCFVKWCFNAKILYEYHCCCDDNINTFQLCFARLKVRVYVIQEIVYCSVMLRLMYVLVDYYWTRESRVPRSYQRPSFPKYRR